MRQVVAAGGEAGVLVPVEVVASHSGGVTGVAVTYGQMQCYGAVASFCGGEEMRRCLGRSGVCGSVPSVAVANVDNGIASVDIGGKYSRDGTVAERRNIDGGIGAEHRIGLHPVHEVIACVGGGGQRDVGEVVHRGSAADRTHRGVGRLGRDGILVVVEVGMDGTVSQSLDGESGSRAEYIISLVGPVHKVVSVVRYSRQRDIGQIIDRRRTGDATHRRVGGAAGDGVLVVVEVGGQRGVAHREHRQRIHCGDFGVGGIGPVHEVVTVVGGSAHRTAQEVLHLARTVDATHRAVARDDSHVVDIRVKHRYDGAVLQRLHRNCSRRRHLDAVGVNPVHEVVARVGIGRQLHIRQIIHRRRTADRTHNGVGRLACDGVLVVVEVGRQRGVAHREHRQRIHCGDFGVGGIGPVHEVVTVVGGSAHRTAQEVLHLARTVDATHRAVARDDSHVVDIRVKHRYDGAVLQRLHRNCSRRRHLDAVGVNPVHEVVARVGIGRQLHIRQIIHRRRTADRTHNGVGRLACDGILVVVKVGRQRGVAHREHRQRVRGGYLCAKGVGPVHEVVTVIGGSAHRTAQEVLHLARTVDATHRRVGTGNRDHVNVGVEHRREGAVAESRNTDGVVGAEHSVSLLPAHKVVTLVRCRCQLHIGQVVHRRRTGNRAHNRVGRLCRHRVLVVVEVGNQCSVANRCNRQRIHRRDGVARGIAPVCEVVAVVVGGRQLAVQEVLDRRRTIGGTHRRVRTGYRYIIYVSVKHSVDRGVLQRLHLHRRRGGHLVVGSVHPVHEVVTHIRLRRQRHIAQVVHRRGARHIAHDGHLGLAGDGILVIVEVRHQRRISHGEHRQRVRRRDDGTEGVAPVHEVVAIVRIGLQLRAQEVLHLPCAGGTAHRAVPARCNHVVDIGVKDGRQCTVAQSLHIDCGLQAKHRVRLHPSQEVVTHIWLSREGYIT